MKRQHFVQDTLIAPDSEGLAEEASPADVVVVKSGVGQVERDVSSASSSTSRQLRHFDEHVAEYIVPKIGRKTAKRSRTLL